MPPPARRLRLLGVTVACSPCSRPGARPTRRRDSEPAVPGDAAVCSATLDHSCRRTDGRCSPFPRCKPDGFHATRRQEKGSTRYRTQRLDWKPCGHGFSCSTMLVPLDYAKPDGTAITLAVAKRPATGDEARQPDHQSGRSRRLRSGLRRLLQCGRAGGL